jgi:hypothetical protein
MVVVRATIEYQIPICYGKSQEKKTRNNYTPKYAASQIIKMVTIESLQGKR